MKGDFSRDTFNSAKHFSRVLMQQGRVQLDADWNEQAAILLHYLRALTVDLIGPFAGPTDNGFAISPAGAYDFRIGKGHYYVEGILCENDPECTYTNQPDYHPLPENAKLQGGNPANQYVVYLDVWERHVTYLEDEDADDNNPSIREVALSGPDTASRAKVIWQVKVTEKLPDDTTAISDAATAKQLWLDKEWVRTNNKWQPGNRGQLKARAKVDPEKDTAPCTASPETRYRGLENQLYRVEIHRGGKAWTGEVDSGEPAGNAGEAATFKWSRENGSVVFPVSPILGIVPDDTNKTTTVSLKHLGQDPRLSLAEGDWVEIVNDDYVLQNCAEPLLQVYSIDRTEMKVTLNGVSKVSSEPGKHPLLRRWDHKAKDSQEDGLELSEGAALIKEGTDESAWLRLEQGVYVQFQKLDPASQYRPSDYWLIPARRATGDVEWPGPLGNPQAELPHGVEHYYAPLWIISVDGSGTVTADPANNCRRKFTLTLS